MTPMTHEVLCYSCAIRVIGDGEHRRQREERDSSGCLWLPVAWASSKDNFERWQGSDNFVFENSPKLMGEMKYYF